MEENAQQCLGKRGNVRECLGMQGNVRERLNAWQCVGMVWNGDMLGNAREGEGT